MNKKILTATLLLAGSASTGLAGPFIIAGTDADDHGNLSAGLNDNGWLFMQRALENIRPGVTNGQTTVAILGSSAGTALTAATSAFTLSNLPTNLWNAVVIDGTTALNDFFAGTSLVNINNTGIIMMDSAGNVGGGTTGAELGVFTANAGVINTYLGAGGGLFSQANGYGWISALLPSLTINADGSRTGLALTAAGNAAFPGLTNADLSAGPWHEYFTNVGTLPILAVASTGNPDAVILGASGGTITDPDPPSVPDSGSTIVLMFGSMCSLIAGRRLLKKRAAKA